MDSFKPPLLSLQTFPSKTPPPQCPKCSRVKNKNEKVWLIIANMQGALPCQAKCKLLPFQESPMILNSWVIPLSHSQQVTRGVGFKLWTLNMSWVCFGFCVFSFFFARIHVSKSYQTWSASARPLATPCRENGSIGYDHSSKRSQSD